MNKKSKKYINDEILEKFYERCPIYIHMIQNKIVLLNDDDKKKLVDNLIKFFDKYKNYSFLLTQYSKFDKATTKTDGLLFEKKPCGNDIHILKYLLKNYDNEEALNTFIYNETGKILHQEYCQNLFKTKSGNYNLSKSIKKISDRLNKLKEKNFVFKFTNVYDYNRFFYILVSSQDERVYLNLYIHFFLKYKTINLIKELQINYSKLGEVLKKFTFNTSNKNLADLTFEDYEDYFNDLIEKFKKKYKKNDSENEEQESYENNLSHYHNLNDIDGEFDIEWDKLKSDDEYFQSVMYKIKELLENENYIVMLEKIANLISN